MKSFQGLESLPPPRLRFPVLSGRYEVSAGLRPVRFEEALEFDQLWAEYRRVREQGRRERLEKYLPPPVETSAETLNVIAHRLIDVLVERWGDCFERRGERALYCALSDELIAWSSEGGLDPARSRFTTSVAYRDLWDAVTAQTQEDFAVWRLDAEREWLGAASLFFPNHWGAEEKIGRGFAAVHAPVADFEPLARRARQFAEIMVMKGPFERFAWGLATDARLNHHPEAPPGEEAAWHGRAFDVAAPRLYLRTERQTLTPFADRGAGLFTIRTSFRDVATLTREERALVASAIEGMGTEARRYKGLTQSGADILAWLASLP